MIITTDLGGIRLNLTEKSLKLELTVSDVRKKAAFFGMAVFFGMSVFLGMAVFFGKDVFFGVALKKLLFFRKFGASCKGSSLLQ